MLRDKLCLIIAALLLVGHIAAVAEAAPLPRKASPVPYAGRSLKRPQAGTVGRSLLQIGGYNYRPFFGPRDVYTQLQGRSNMAGGRQRSAVGAYLLTGPMLQRQDAGMAEPVSPTIGLLGSGRGRRMTRYSRYPQHGVADAYV